MPSSSFFEPSTLWLEGFFVVSCEDWGQNRVFFPVPLFDNGVMRWLCG
ncbi:hypothetical protein D082_19990 [Synechocystis sp. PCC 6714]|nr:hypothetical protein D082_19990 [Synechocystis sp. PCC 6714]